VLPGRLGLRFALEALFLVLLAVGAGLADLRPLYIVLIMAVAWILVALVEFTAERISRAPLSYLLPAPAEPSEDTGEPAWPMPEERTVVAPPEQRLPEPGPEPEPVPELLSEPEQEPEPEPEPEPLPEPIAEEEPEQPEEAVDSEETEEEPRRRRFGFLRRSERADDEEPPPPPRHVKLLPRRTAPEESSVSQEVAELFDRPDEAPEERSG
jgi:outer membrane biosynthesis protein TonB